ncbi:MAG: sugar phosphate isomerase/epimerase [Arcticibacterium sp.]|jgi:sugar phosphate isomerase/epimerase
MDRRTFVKNTGLAAVSIPFMGGSNPAPSLQKKHPICIFSKHLQWLDFEDVGKYVRDLGFDGVDLAVRRKGHVLPEEVEIVLPRAIELIKKSGVEVPMMATNIADEDSPYALSVIRTAAAHGIEFYRMAYINFDNSMSMEANLLSIRSSMEKLATLNEKHGIKASYQNHAGTALGSAIWDMWYVLKEMESTYVGLQFDVRHAVVEGGKSWENEMRLAKDFTNCTVLKDFHWEKLSNGKWDIKNVPMGEGMVDFDTYFEHYKNFNFQGPISVHIEYPMFDEMDKTLTKKEKFKFATKFLSKDLEFIRNGMKKAGITL